MPVRGIFTGLRNSPEKISVYPNPKRERGILGNNCLNPKSQSLTDVSGWDFKAWKYQEVNLGLVLSVPNRSMLLLKVLRQEAVDLKQSLASQFESITVQIQVASRLLISEGTGKLLLHIDSVLLV